MKAVIALTLLVVVAVNAGLYTETHQIHNVAALHAPIVHAAPVAPVVHTITPVLHTSSSSSYKYRAPAAKIAVASVATPVVHHAPVYAAAAPVLHMSHGVLLH